MDEFYCKNCKKSMVGGDGICLNCGDISVGEESDEDLDSYGDDYELEDYDQGYADDGDFEN